MTHINQICLSTEKNTPAEAELISHKLMLRAGLINKTSSGIYTWLPIGLRVIRKIENIIRDCLNTTGAQEILMPMIQPKDLWQQTQRWQKYGPELLRIKDRHEREFCLGPTHEEIITDWAKHNFNSYKQLPACLYQIQTKFRDEIRPRFGVMRSREFIMKDAYSFHASQECLDTQYQIILDTYHKIFTKIGLNFTMVEADSGSIGGKKSHEFQAISANGEDHIAHCINGNYAANVEQAYAIAPKASNTSIQAYTTHGPDNNTVILILRAEDTPNTTLIYKHDLIKAKSPIKPIKLESLSTQNTIIADEFAANLTNFSITTTTNTLTNLNWGDDIKITTTANLRQVKNGDLSPCENGELTISKGIEVGHIFQLEECYSAPMQATINLPNGTTKPMLMGCYGIGISRIAAAIIEQSHDEHGIIWPASIAPFDIHLIAFNSKDENTSTAAETLYQKLTTIGYEVLFDNRPQSPGKLLADADLIGIPWRIIISSRSLDQGGIELKARNKEKSQIIAIEDIIYALQGLNNST